MNSYCIHHGTYHCTMTHGAPMNNPQAARVQPTMTAHRQLTVADLSSDQLEVYQAVMTWLRVGSVTKRTLTIGGFAGVGKSALISVVAHELLKAGPVAFAAFTGKASSVLGRKLATAGIATVNRIVRADLLGGGRAFEPRPYCGTIHGLIFRPCDVCMVEEMHEHTFGGACREKGDPMSGVAIEGGAFVLPSDAKCLACDPPPPVKRDGPCHRCGGNRYLRRDQLDRKYRLIVIDEASMVSDDMLDALKSYGVLILAVGDHGQLPPVRGMGSLMKHPDLKLEKIHRQAEGNPIIALSARIRATGDIDDSLEDGDAFTIVSRRDLGDWISKRFTLARLEKDPRTPEGIMGTVLISWTNKLRVGLNYDVREALGLKDAPPSRGEVVICLKNAAPIYNGMRGVLEYDCERAGDAGGKAPKWKASVDFCEDGQRAENILLSEHQFFAEKTIDYDQACALGVSMAQLGSLYDFGYALTCHKCQGSQAPEVGVVLEPGLSRMGRDDRQRWIYTSCTRSEKKLTIIR
jgi:exodeoxyribonuclease V